MIDFVMFISANVTGGHCILFACDPFLYKDLNSICGKLIYSQKPIYGSDSIPVLDTHQNLFKAAYRQGAGEGESASTDFQLQDIGVSLGLDKGTGFDRHLCCLPAGVSGTVMAAPNFISHIKDNDAYQLAIEIGEKYKIAPDDLMVTGGLHLFPKPIHKAHDIDIVVPIDNIKQLRKIPRISFSNRSVVCEYGYRWPLRWWSAKGHLICPFFIYRGLQPCVSGLTSTGEVLRNTLTVSDDRFGIFNSPILCVDGGCNVIICRSTLLRGMFRNGDRLDINCPLYRITKGAMSGAIAAVVTDPFHEIKNLGSILNAYHN